MQRSLLQIVPRNEAGQALPLLGLFFMVLIGFTALSIDVGRYVWARTSIQAGVDAAALAAAQSMPSQTDAEAKAAQYWIDNSGFIQSAGENVSFTVTYPQGNKAIAVRGEADIPTWFAKFFGVDHWHVWAEGEAESQVLDIALVLDVSGSMCWGSYAPIDRNASGQQGAGMGPGRTADTVTLSQQITASQSGTFDIFVNRVDIFRGGPQATPSSSQIQSWNNSKFGYNTTTPYWNYTPSNSRRGMIKIDNEIFQITQAPNTTNNSLRVTRAHNNTFLGTGGVASAHSVGAKVYTYHSNCSLAAPAASGPFDFHDGVMSQAGYFTTLFDPAYDKIGLASYQSSATNRRALTHTFSNVQSSIAALLPDGGTNSAHGIAVGRQILDGTGKRANAVRVLVFMTDGRANAYCGNSYVQSNYNSTSCSNQGSGVDGNARAVADAVAEATRAANGDIIIYTIGFGPYVDDAFLTNIANIGKGQYYKAPTVQQLDEAFEAIAEQTHIALVR